MDSISSFVTDPKSSETVIRRVSPDGLIRITETRQWNFDRGERSATIEVFIENPVVAPGKEWTQWNRVGYAERDSDLMGRGLRDATVNWSAWGSTYLPGATLFARGMAVAVDLASAFQGGATFFPGQPESFV